MWLSQLRLVNFRNYRGLRLEPQPGRAAVQRPQRPGQDQPPRGRLCPGHHALAAHQRRTRAAQLAHRPKTLTSPRSRRPLPASTRACAARTARSTSSSPSKASARADNGATRGARQPRSIKVNGLADARDGPGRPAAGGVLLARRRRAGRRLTSRPPPVPEPGHFAGVRQPPARACSATTACCCSATRCCAWSANAASRPTRARAVDRADARAGAPRSCTQRLTMLRDDASLPGQHFSRSGGRVWRHSRVMYRSTACSTDLDHAVARGDRATTFRERQAQLATREIEQAVSLVGPHRDDFTFMLDDVDLNTYGSRGQQRLAVLALKLAEADWMRADPLASFPSYCWMTCCPSSIPQRRAVRAAARRRARASEQRQVWITTTEPDLLVHRPSRMSSTSAQRFVIDAGQVRTA